MQKSANILKKYLPSRYHARVRFLQNPDTWLLGVLDKKIATQLVDILSTHYDEVMRDDLGLPQHVKLVRVYRHWERSGELMSALKLRYGSHIHRLKQVISIEMQNKIRLLYRPSIWQINVENSITATQLNWLLDELSMRIAKDIKFAPKLKVSVTPSNWKDSGFSISELVIEKLEIPSQQEAESYLASFLATSAAKK